MDKTDLSSNPTVLLMGHVTFDQSHYLAQSPFACL